MPSKLLPLLPGFARQDIAYRGLAIALGLSLLAHMALLGKLQFSLPVMDLSERAVAVQLAAPVILVPNAATKKISLAEPEPEPVTQRLETAPTPPAIADVIAQPSALPEAMGEILANETPDNAEISASTEMPTADEPFDAEADPSAGNSYTTDGMPATAAYENPTYIETDFDVRRSIGGGKVGVTHISYQVQPDGNYSINSVSEAEGLLSLFLSDKLVQRSVGKVTENGLQPTQFLYHFGDKASKKQLATFDWQAGELTLQSSKGIKSEALPAGTQDLLSFMYQFMFVPPLEQMNLSVTNGKSLSTYSYSFEGEAQLATKAGEISTVHILKKGDDGEEKTELWLAVDYHYLPVKMRKTEEDGSVVEQVATSISTNTLK